MWPKLWQVVLCITISVLIDEGYGLMCLRCESRNVNGSCKIGGKSRLSRERYQTCYGRKPKCYIKATVDENGSAHFKRGCTLKKICAENAGLDLEYCSTCSHKYCNYHSMELDKEVEEYLKDLKLSKNHTVTSTEAITKQATPSPKTVLKPLSETVTEGISKTVPEAVPGTLPKPVSDTVSNTAPKTVSNSVPKAESDTVPKTVSVTLSKSVPANVTEK